SVTIIDVVTAGTVEEQQMQRLAEKPRRLEEINRDRERLRAAGISTQHLDAEEAILAMADLGEEGEGINEQSRATSIRFEVEAAAYAGDPECAQDDQVDV